MALEETIKSIFNLRSVMMRIRFYGWIIGKTLGYVAQVSNLGRSLQPKVCTIVHNDGWRWPRSRIRDIIAKTALNLMPHPEREDSVIWN